MTKRRADLDANKYQMMSQTTAIYPGKSAPLGLMYVALKLSGEAGEFSEHLGKAMRDDGFSMGNDLTDAHKELLIKELGDVMWYVAAACTELDVTMAEVMHANLEKLRDRAARGVLGGSGDSR